MKYSLFGIKSKIFVSNSGSKCSFFGGTGMDDQVEVLLSSCLETRLVLLGIEHTVATVPAD